MTAVLELHTKPSCVCLWALSEDAAKRHRTAHTSVSLQFRIIPISIFIRHKVKYYLFLFFFTSCESNQREIKHLVSLDLNDKCG